MYLIKCEKQHYYDSDKFVSCPHCANEVAGVKLTDLTGRLQQDVDTASPEETADISRPKTAGWLVCTQGLLLGESYILREGENHIGRAAHMDIRLTKEPSVSRENHAVITFLPENNSFFLSSETHADTVRLNGKPLPENSLPDRKTDSGSALLKHGDLISLGACTLMFIPLCGNGFSWEQKT